MTQRRRLARALLAALLLALGACGSSERPYHDRVGDVLQRHSGTIQRLQTEAGVEAPSDRAGAAGSLERLSDELTAVADEVARIKPPDAHRADADRLVDAYRLLSRATLELRTGLVTGDAGATSRGRRDYATAAELERRAAAALRDA